MRIRPGTQLPGNVTVLPSGDLWSPKMDPGEPNVDLESLPTPPGLTKKEKVDEALEKAGPEHTCPWCDLPFPGKVSLKEHIESSHMSVVASDTEQREVAGMAAVRRAQVSQEKGATKKKS